MKVQLYSFTSQTTSFIREFLIFGHQTKHAHELSVFKKRDNWTDVANDQSKYFAAICRQIDDIHLLTHCKHFEKLLKAGFS